MGTTKVELTKRAAPGVSGIDPQSPECTEQRFNLAASYSAGSVLSPRGRYFIKTFGCQMNLHDSERIAGLLEDVGYVGAVCEEEADLVVFNTCCVRENADERLYGNIGRLKARKAKEPDFRIAVGGCLAQKDREALIEKTGSIDVVFGTHNIHRVPELLEIREKTGQPVCEIWEEPSEGIFTTDLPQRRKNRYSAWVVISVGCDNTCTFCIVPHVRGPERSRPPEEIVDEVKRLVEDGVVEITLLGQNVNSYGRDLKLDGHKPLFANLLYQLQEIEGLKRIRFTSPHPKDLRIETIEAMAECSKVMPHLHLPLQSGSNRILRAMHRGYTAERYLERLELARQAVDDLAVTTDIIVGFPGETDEDFEATLDVCKRAKYDGAYMFLFSPRPGTPAAKLPYDIPQQALQERFSRLVELIEKLSFEAHRNRVGRIEEVLVEGKESQDARRWRGRTAQNKVVLFEESGDFRTGNFRENFIDRAEHLGGRIAPGQFVKVKVTAAGPHHLEGEVVGSRARGGLGSSPVSEVGSLEARPRL
jgi:tRNA-2-methylthio-N6-dimethylallyladenosine synthase